MDQPTIILLARIFLVVMALMVMGTVVWGIIQHRSLLKTERIQFGWGDVLCFGMYTGALIGLVYIAGIALVDLVASLS